MSKIILDLIFSSTSLACKMSENKEFASFKKFLELTLKNLDSLEFATESKEVGTVYNNGFAQFEKALSNSKNYLQYKSIFLACCTVVRTEDFFSKEFKITDTHLKNNTWEKTGQRNEFRSAIAEDVYSNAVSGALCSFGKYDSFSRTQRTDFYIEGSQESQETWKYQIEIFTSSNSAEEHWNKFIKQKTQKHVSCFIV